MSDSREDLKKTQGTDKRGLDRYRTELPNIIFDSDLDVYELALYVHLKHIAASECNYSASDKDLSEKIKISIRKIKKAKKSLEKKGLIKNIKNEIILQGVRWP